MAVTETRELLLAKAYADDAYGVTVEMRKKRTPLTPDQARELADELYEAARAAERAHAEDVVASSAAREVWAHAFDVDAPPLSSWERLEVDRFGIHHEDAS